MLDVRGTGCTGYELADALRASYDIHVELAQHATIVLVIGIAQPIEPLDRFAHNLGEIVKRVSRDAPLPPFPRLPAAAPTRRRSRRGMRSSVATKPCRWMTPSAGSRVS